MKGRHFFVYPKKTVLYTGVTNELTARMEQHLQNQGNKATFADKHNCYNFIYYETFSGIEQAIAREKEIKGWMRAKKESLISTTNPD